MSKTQRNKILNNDRFSISRARKMADYFKYFSKDKKREKRETEPNIRDEKTTLLFDIKSPPNTDKQI